MTSFNFLVSTDGAAFRDDNRYYEVARLLREAADEMENEHVDFSRVSDISGNRAGYWTFQEDVVQGD